MSRMRERRAWIYAGWMPAVVFFAAAHAQYPGRVDANKGAAAPVLRATAVLEYTGDLTKPTAARLLPLVVWDGERYQPGGLYLANPVPLTVETGTVYELLDAGTSKGLFDVTAAANVQGAWVAVGSYQKLAPPKVSKLKPSKTLPQFVKDSGSLSDSDKPTLHRRTDSGSSPNPGSGSGTSSNTASSAPAVDPDRPTLHKRTDSGSGAGSDSGSESGSGSSTKTNAPPVDPDRPTLHKQSTTNPNDNGAPVSATTNTDPDRPHLGRGVPEEQQKLDVPSTVDMTKAAGNPANLKLIAAVSDTRTMKEPRSYMYSWSDPEDAKKMQAALEEVAKNVVAGNPLPVANTGQRFGSGTTTQSKAGVSRTGAAKVGSTAHKAAPQSTLPELADEEFKAYELSFGGGATLVFTASSGQKEQRKWVTIIAQPDFNGVPQILFRQVTSEAQLDAVPRMQLVDAVDTDADNRAELIFELVGRTDQQFAIYKVHDKSVEQVFSTGGS
ncbi:MAG: hypothetical protein JOZ83_05840 [Silvibacterium sp.]|nr:hypothetical protein [Silvibacterium sp.]